MPTRTEAAEALYRAAQDLICVDWGVSESTDNRLFGPVWSRFCDAVRGYNEGAPQVATPDVPALPAEVARVVEAADAWADEPLKDNRPLGYMMPTARELCEAVRAYRSSFPAPEPLSARLARLKAGSVVNCGSGENWTILGNAPDLQTLWVRCNGLTWIAYYDAVDRIISESP